MKRFFIIPGLVVLLGMPAQASPDDDRCTSAPRNQWMSPGQIAEHFERRGYEVRKVERDGACYEVYAIRRGQWLEMYVDPANGRIVYIDDD